MASNWGEMSKGIVRCKRIIAAENLTCRQQFFPHLFMYHLLCNSTASYSSSSSRKSSSVHNYYIRKRRKWPIRPYQNQWVESFAFQLAKHSFKESIRKSRNNLLSDLLNSFAAYEIEPSPPSYGFLFQVLIQKRPQNWDDQIRQILDHIEQVEKHEMPESIFMDLIKFYGDNDMLQDAVDLFFRIPKLRCKPSVVLLNAMLSILCRKQNGLEIVPRILIKSQEMMIRIEDSSYGILVRALCKIGKLSDALTLLNHMVEEGFGVDHKACSVMLATMCSQVNCNAEETMGFLEDLRSLGFEPRKGDFRNMIQFLVRKRKGLDALELLKQMKMSGIQPDVMCYSLVLDGLIHNGEFFRADKVFDELLVSGLVPDIRTYNVYIEGLCMQKKVEDGMKMIGSMEDLGCPPDMNTYNTILRALGDAGELERMREVRNGIKQKGLKLNSHTYRIMVDSFISKSEIHEACSLLNEMVDGNLVPLPTTLNEIICWLAENGSRAKAVKLLEEMAVNDIAPGKRTWQALIQAHDLALNVEKMDDLAKTSSQLSLCH